MCGIAGSRSRESGFELYRNNLNRGYYSSSVTCIYPKGYFVLKTEGAFTLEDIPFGANYYLFHSRGPTVQTTIFDWDDNHPFQYGRFIVAHNGIIENADSLYRGEIGVDSRVIPYLLDKEYRLCKDVDRAIHITLSMLQGTFGLWIYDTTTRDIRIVRSDITLFNYGTEFSSSNPGYQTEVPQNIVYGFQPGSNKMTEQQNLKPTKKPKYFIANALKP